MDKNELLNGIEEDLTINQSNIETKMYTIPGLHAKYLRYFFDSKLKYNKKNKELSILYKTMYYDIQDKSNEILNQKEIIFNLLADPQYSKLNLEVQTLADLVDILDRTIKKVNTISFDIKNIISFRAYLDGMN